MDIISILLLILFAVILFKIAGVLIHAGIFVLTIPIKIIGLVLGLFCSVLFAVFTGVAGLLIIPLILLLPFLLVILAVIYLIRQA